MKLKPILIIATIFLSASNVFLLVEIAKTRAELAKTQIMIEKCHQENETLVFLDLLMEKVLKNEGEINFDDRLLLENAVRAIGDSAILKYWNRLTSGQNENEMQKEMKNLLAALVKKVKNGCSVPK